MQTYLSRPWFFPWRKIQDSLGFWTPRRGFRIPGTGFPSLSVKLRFWIPVVSIVGFQITNCRISDSKKKNFPECRITRAKMSRIPEPAFPYVRRHDSKRYISFRYQISFHCLVFKEIFIRAHEHRKHLGLRYQDVAKRNSRLPVIWKRISVFMQPAKKDDYGIFILRLFWFQDFKHFKTKTWDIFSTYRIYSSKCPSSNKRPPRITTHHCCSKLRKFNNASLKFQKFNNHPERLI